ncbi:MAG TPA: OadG family protein [Planctomycetaceae bacterium]|nr:OadG family protein [Planctomycetaceae bacterium]
MPLVLDLHRVLEHDGLEIAVTGMLIVFAVLALVSGFIALLPRALARLEAVLPAPHDAHAPRPPSAAAGDEVELLAAVAFCLHLEIERGRREH